MSVPLVELSRIVRLHYGAALKEVHCNQTGSYEVFGSAGVVGRHTEALFDYPSIVIGRKGSVGAVTYAPNGGWAIDTAFFVELLRLEESDLRYLYYVLRATNLARHTITTSIPGLSRDDVYRTRIPLPSLSEQRRIAHILDKADTIRQKRHKAIALTEELQRSAFLELFGDPVTNPMEWPSEWIDDLCARGASLVDGPFGSSLKPEHYVSEGIKVVRNWNIYDDRFDSREFKFVTPTKFEEIRRSEVMPGDILLTTKGTVGDVCVAPDLGGPAVLSASGTVRLRLPPDGSYLPDFVVAQMILPSFKRYLHGFEAGSAQQYLNLSAIRRMRVIRPPMDRQRMYSRIREQARAVGITADKAHADSDRLFNSLVERCFTSRPI